MALFGQYGPGIEQVSEINWQKWNLDEDGLEKGKLMQKNTPGKEKLLMKRK
jgi:hypothetical protein